MSGLEVVERETGPYPSWSVIWLHGLGADGNDFVPILPQLVRSDWPAIRFVFPHAPVRKVTINGGLEMRAWYDIGSVAAITSQADVAGIAESVQQVNTLIDREGARGVGPSRIVLAGFSQGGAVTLAAGVQREVPLAGLVGLSTYLPVDQESLTRAPAETLRQPVFLAHGSLDSMLPIGLGEASRDGLLAAGFDVDWQAYPMGHEVCLEEIDALGNWLGARFAS